MSQLIGYGTYSEVFLNKKNNAVKVYTSNLELETTAELNILFSLNSKYLVKGITAYISHDKFCIEMEKLTSFSKNYLLELSPIDIKKYIYELALGLEHLHSNNYIHLDITLKNCMFSNENAKLIDFGLSKKVIRNEKNEIEEIYSEHEYVTIVNRPYENFTGTDINLWSDKTDIWSLAVVFIHFLSRKSVEEIIKLEECEKYSYLLAKELAKSPKKYLNNILIDEFKNDQCIDLLLNMLNTKKERFDIKKVLNHDFFMTPFSLEIISQKPIFILEKNDYKNKYISKCISEIKNIIICSFPDENINLFFTSINLLIRYVYLKENINIIDIYNISYFCVILCAKLLYSIYELEDYDITFNDTNYYKYYYEIEILSKVGYIVEEKDNIFSGIKNIELAYMVYDNIFVNFDTEKYVNFELFKDFKCNINLHCTNINFKNFIDHKYKLKHKALEDILSLLKNEYNDEKLELLTLTYEIYHKFLGLIEHFKYDADDIAKTAFYAAYKFINQTWLPTLNVNNEILTIIENNAFYENVSYNNFTYLEQIQLFYNKIFKISIESSRKLFNNIDLEMTSVKYKMDTGKNKNCKIKNFFDFF